VVGNAVVQAYQRSSMLERRRPVMQAWANFLSDKTAAKVVSISAEGSKAKGGSGHDPYARLDRGLCPAASAGQVTDAMHFMEKNGCDAARESWLPLAEKGDAVAQFDIGMIYQCGGDCGCARHNYWEAFKWFKKAADGGNPEAEDILPTKKFEATIPSFAALRHQRKASE
jgi:TPR repeat protein